MAEKRQAELESLLMTTPLNVPPAVFVRMPFGRPPHAVASRFESHKAEALCRPAKVEE